MLDINLGLTVYTLVLFAITMYVLYKFLFGPISKVIDQRQQAVHAQLQEAEEAKAEAQKLAAEYREQRQSARAEADEIVERAKRAGEVTREEILAKAEAEGQRRAEESRKAVEADVRQAQTALRAQAADLVVTAAERVTRRRMSDDDALRMVEEAIEEFDFDELAGTGARANGSGAASSAANGASGDPAGADD